MKEGYLNYRSLCDVLRVASADNLVRVFGADGLDERGNLVVDVDLDCGGEFLGQLRCHPHPHGPEADETKFSPSCRHRDSRHR